MMHMFGPVIVSVITAVLFGFLCLGACNRWLGVWACNRMGWHLKPTETGFDGCSANGTCPRCGNRVLQDSQGNWF